MALSLDPSQIKQVIGQEIGVSAWFTVTQESINTFADVTEDHQFIHVDADRSAATPFGGTIAHGFFTLSMLSYLAESGAGVTLKGAKMGMNYGFDKVRFIQPVAVGSRIRARGVLLDVAEKNPGQFLFKKHITVEIEDADKPALIAEWLVMVVI